MQKERRYGLRACLFVGLLTTACGGQPEFIFTLPTTDGEVVSFVAVTSDPDILIAARQELAQSEDKRHLYILGPVAEGDGGHNTGWNWHFVPDAWELTDTSMDLCDADPAFVEVTIVDWARKIGHYCPKDSRLLEER
tara:strand:+ start:334 stop:744 length:411 start_codon:yes stop_codon:yes gene_type:complete